MAENEPQWEYCDITFQLRYKGEDISRSGQKVVWLLFKAVVSGAERNYVVGEAEIPMSGNVAGVSFVPQGSIAGHKNIHQNLLDQLQKDGWKLLPERGSAWWERRLRRPMQPKRSFFEWLKGR